MYSLSASVNELPADTGDTANCFKVILAGQTAEIAVSLNGAAAESDTMIERREIEDIKWKADNW